MRRWLSLRLLLLRDQMMIWNGEFEMIVPRWDKFECKFVIPGWDADGARWSIERCRDYRLSTNC